MCGRVVPGHNQVDRSDPVVYLQPPDQLEGDQGPHAVTEKKTKGPQITPRRVEPPAPSPARCSPGQTKGSPDSGSPGPAVGCRTRPDLRAVRIASGETDSAPPPACGTQNNRSRARGFLPGWINPGILGIGDVHEPAASRTRIPSGVDILSLDNVTSYLAPAFLPSQFKLKVDTTGAVRLLRRNPRRSCCHRQNPRCPDLVVPRIQVLPRAGGGNHGVGWGVKKLRCR